jgi:hypothetical protein
MGKPEKYLVLTRRCIIALYNQVIEEQINGGFGGVVIRCQMASRKYPGQLQLTDETQSDMYSYWPTDGDEVFKVEGAV